MQGCPPGEGPAWQLWVETENGGLGISFFLSFHYYFYI